MDEDEYEPAGRSRLDQERIRPPERNFEPLCGRNFEPLDALMIMVEGARVSTAGSEAWRSTWTRAFAACA